MMLDYRDVAPAHQIYVHCPRCAGTLRHEPDANSERIRPLCERCGWTYLATNLLGALVVVETDSGIVMVHPPMGTPDAPASLAGGLVEYAETPEAGAIRLVREQTGIEVELIEELTRFLQDGTPFGPVLDFGYLARAVGGELRTDGPEGPAAIYAPENIPPIISVRVANQRVLDAYLARRPEALAGQRSLASQVAPGGPMCDDYPVALAEISRLAAQLDGVSESRREGLLDWRYRGRLVARQLDDSRIVVRASFEFRDLLLQSFPETFSVPKRFAKHMMVVADIENGNSDAVEDAVIGAWELQSRE